MGQLSGRKVSENLVAFGNTVSDKQLEALKRQSPTGNEILQGLGLDKQQAPNQEKPEEQLPKKLPNPDPIKVTMPKRKKRGTLVKKTEEINQKPEEVLIEEETTANNKLPPDLKISKLISESVTTEEKLVTKKQLKPTKDLFMDLDQELAALSKEVEKKAAPPPEPVIQEASIPEATMRSQILQALEGEANAPDEATLENWKAQYGKNGIYVMAFGEGDVYIYHHLTRGQWRKIREVMDKLGDSPERDSVEEKLKEKVIQYCTLWPQLDPAFFLNCKAGIVDSLYQVILINSGFLNTQQAMLLTTQL